MAESRAQQSNESWDKTESGVTEVDVRSQILSAGLTLFVERGYARTTMTNIYESTGVTSSQLSRYFKTKENLFRSLYGNYDEQLRQTFSTLKREVKDTAERFFAIIEFLFHLGHTSPESIQFIFEFNHSHILPDLTSLESSILNVIESCISEGIKAGTIRRIDRELASAFFYGATKAALLVYFSKNRQCSQRISLDRAINQTWRSTWKMIGQDAAAA